MSSATFVVVVEHGGGHQTFFGPFPGPDEARKFAQWASAEIDPAEYHWLRSPVGELLTWAGTVVKEERDANQDA